MDSKNVTFSFGENWMDYLRTIDDEDLSAANKDILDWLSPEDIINKKILDIGSGSGIHSYCFHQLGVNKLTSIDVDAKSVEATNILKDRAGKQSNWEILRGSILDNSLLKSLGKYDVVYSWGVLHHTGEMWNAIENASCLVQPGGLFWISLYTKGPGYSKDLADKQKYNNLSSLGKKVFISRIIIKTMWKRFKRGKNPFTWNEKVDRGMHKLHDILDWYGGLPYEVASKNEVVYFMNKKNFQLVRAQERKERTCSIYLFKNINP